MLHLIWWGIDFEGESVWSGEIFFTGIKIIKWVITIIKTKLKNIFTKTLGSKAKKSFFCNK